jgi:5-methylcytosine-specific restriction endonuclease McrA
MPCHPARARQLLRAGKAAVFRRYPFTIILKDRVGGDTQPVTLKVDPGSQTTGMVLVGHFHRGDRVIWAGEISHRGETVRQKLLARRQVRRSRRSRKTRYRPSRFDNRRRPEGWLPPSLRSRVGNVETWVHRLRRWCPVTGLALELAKFDPQKLQHPEISGVEYQHGELWGYEVREYLLEKWGRRCVYCGATDIPLQMEHLTPKARGGSNRVTNLAPACEKCNQRKGHRTAAEFGFPHLQAQANQPLRGSAAVNATRWAIYQRLQATGLPVAVGTGGRTKFNRVRQGYPKAHWIDAACVGETGQPVSLDPEQVSLVIHAVGRGSRQMCRMDRYGFPRTSAKQAHRVHGFQTGDLVRAVVPQGQKAGTHPGRVAVRASGSFRVGAVDGISWRFCRKLHSADGYAYAWGRARCGHGPSSPDSKSRVSGVGRFL